MSFCIRSSLAALAIEEKPTVVLWRGLLPQTSAEGEVVDVRGTACSLAGALLQFGDWRVENCDEDFFETGAWEEYIPAIKGEPVSEMLWARCILAEAFSGNHIRSLVTFETATVILPQ